MTLTETVRGQTSSEAHTSSAPHPALADDECGDRRDASHFCTRIAGHDGAHCDIEDAASPWAHTDSPATNIDASPSDISSPGTKTERGQWLVDTQVNRAPLPTLDGSQLEGEPQTNAAAVTPFPLATLLTTPNCDARAGFLYDGYLCLLSDSLDDLESQRIAIENRVRALTRNVADADGEVRGLGLDDRSPEVAQMKALLDGIATLEHQATLALQRGFRTHPLHPFIKATRGLGEKQTARLLAAIGDPYWNDLHERPRTVSELWAYCGLAVHDGHAQRRTKGQVSNWSDDAKKRVWLIASKCVVVGGPYREVYDTARATYAEATHPHDCARCGPKGKPALTGSSLSLGHQHARALRLVSKTILRDLWAAARSIHHETKP